MDKQWIDFINEELKKEYMASLRSFIEKERAEKTVYPSPEFTFNAFANCPFDRIKAVIIGNSPYPDEFYNGMAFSTNAHSAPEETKSLIYEICQDDLKKAKTVGDEKKKYFKSNNLISWAQQGVLLINNSYTCTSDRNAHNGLWDEFNRSLIYLLNEYRFPLVFVLKNDGKYKELIHRRHTVIIDDPKWSTKINEFLVKRRDSNDAREQHLHLKINWCIL